MAVSFTVHHTCGAVVRIQTQDALRGPICPKCKKSVKVPLWQKVSARLRGARSLTGCLYLLARLVGFCFACVIMIVGWPASGWLASGVALTACLKRRPNKWTKSAVKSLEPFVWATAVLTGLQCALGPSPVEEHRPGVLGGSELDETRLEGICFGERDPCTRESGGSACGACDALSPWL
jgi:hypothetical protein